MIFVSFYFIAELLPFLVNLNVYDTLHVFLLIHLLDFLFDFKKSVKLLFSVNYLKIIRFYRTV